MMPCEIIAGQLGALFTCMPHDRYTKIRTPFLYPDGDVIDVFFRESGDEVVTVTDLGESLRWLRSHTLTPRRTQKQRQLIDDVCLNHGVELFKGMLALRVKKGENLASAVMRLSQASLRVADIWFTLRSRAVQSVTDEVADFLTEREIRFDRAEKQLGRSGRTWTIDFHVWAPERSSLVNVLASGSRASARGVVDHVVAGWYDLSHLGAQSIRLVSLFDDTADVWADEDFRQLEPLSQIARWSRPDEVEELLKAA